MNHRLIIACVLAMACAIALTECGKPAPQQTPEQTAPAPQPSAATSAADTSGAVSQEAAPPAQGAQHAEARLVPITIKLPKPVFVGTPTNIAVPNLEAPLGHPRPPFLAPEGTTNVALRKPVTGSDEQPTIGELAMITDGDKEAAEGSFVELGPGVQYVTVDLKARFTIYAIVVWHYHKQAVVYRGVVVQVADDREMTKNLRTLFNNDIDNVSGRGVGKDMAYVETAEGKLIDAKGVQGRYVRLYSKGNTANDLNHYIEVEVYGRAVQ